MWIVKGDQDGKANLSMGEWIVESVNTTSMKSLKARLMSSDAHVILAQETGVTKTVMNYFVVWARNRGWITSPACAAYAVPCEGGQTSAGALILVRNMVGLGAIQPSLLADLIDGRLAAAVVQFPGFPQMIFGSISLQTGSKLGPVNRSILARWGRIVDSTKLTALLAGDF